MAACFQPRYIRGQGPRRWETVPCGECPACIGRRRNEWTYRIQYEATKSLHCLFVTFTYSPENMPVVSLSDISDELPDSPTLRKRDLQLFFKRLRKLGVKFRYYAVGEYGGQTLRPHYHAIMFFNDDYSRLADKIISSWNLGLCHLGTVEIASIHYVTKYHIDKMDSPYYLLKEYIEPPFTLMSRKPGIGSGYINYRRSYHEGDTKKMFVTHPGGIRGSLPRYYKNKLYTEEECKEFANECSKLHDTRSDAEKDMLYNKFQRDKKRNKKL